MNSTNLIGNLVNDIEVKKTSTGKSVCDFVLAINDGEKADFIDCRAWEKTADIMGNFLSKGSKVGIVGSIKTDTYENKEGKKVKKTYVLASRVEFLNSAKPKTESTNPTNTAVNIGSDDLPFY